MPRNAFSDASMNDAIAVLAGDHRSLLILFERFATLGSGVGIHVRQTLAEILCTELVIHAQVEEEFLYPALRGAPDGMRLADEAAVEHLVARQLVGDIEAMQPGDDLYDARIKVLGDYVRHHIAEEETAIFPRLRETGGQARPDARAAALLARRDELRSEFGMPDDDFAGMSSMNGPEGGT